MINTVPVLHRGDLCRRRRAAAWRRTGLEQRRRLEWALVVECDNNPVVRPSEQRCHLARPPSTAHRGSCIATAWPLHTQPMTADVWVCWAQSVSLYSQPWSWSQSYMQLVMGQWMDFLDASRRHRYIDIVLSSVSASKIQYTQEMCTYMYISKRLVWLTQYCTDNDDIDMATFKKYRICIVSILKIWRIDPSLDAMSRRLNP